MNIHEYQGKAVLKSFGVPVARGIPAFSVDEAVKAAEELGLVDVELLVLRLLGVQVFGDAVALVRYAAMLLDEPAILQIPGVFGDVA